jgi:hypothetical protein
VDDGLLDHRVVRKNAPPVRVERLAVSSRKDRHLVRFRLALVLEERVEVALGHVAEDAHAEAAEETRSAACATDS